MRVRRVVVATAFGALALTVAVTAGDPLASGYENPRLRAALLTAEALVGLLAAFLVLGRFHRGHRAADLLLCCGLTTLALSLGLFGALPATLEDGPTTVTAWSLLLGRLAGAALLVAAAFTPARAPARLRGRAALALVAAGTLALLAAVAVAGPSLPPPGSASPPSQVGLEGPPAAAVLRLLGAALLALAAWRFAVRADAARDPFLGAIALACVLALFARVNAVVHPVEGAGLFGVADVFAVGFHAVILAAAAWEIARIWRAEAALEERRRIARDLHDGLAQELASVVRNLGWLDPSDRFVARARASAGRAVTDARRAIAALDGAGDEPVAAALEEAAVATAAREDARVELELDRTVQDGPAVRQALALITAEAITNAARHGRADVIRVRLEPGESMHLLIEDRGAGFEPRAARGPRREGVGHGLQGMRDRAHGIGASFDLTSRPGEGNCVEVIL